MPGSDMATELLWDVLWKTVLVLILLYAVMWTVRHFSARPIAGRKGAAIQVMQTTHLGQGKALHLVGIGGKTLLVGVTSQQVSLLAELSAADLEDSLERPEAAIPFEQYLGRASGLVASMSSRLKGKGLQAESPAESSPERPNEGD